MPGALKKSRPNRHSRRANNAANKPQPTVAIRVLSVAPAGPMSDTLIIGFDGAVTLKGVPQYTTNIVGITPLSAVLSAPDTLELTFSADVSAATTLNVPPEEPAIRNASGGYVTPVGVAV